MKPLLTLALAACALTAQAETLRAGFFRVSPAVIAAAHIRGDELFGTLVTNLPETSVVDGPQSVVLEIYGSCGLRQYMHRSMGMFSGQMGGGYMMDYVGPDSVSHRVLPRTPIAALFDKKCPKSISQ